MTADTNDLALVRTLDAPRKALWRCWTQPDLLERWFCPEPWHAANARIDLEPGGEFSCVMHGPDGEEFANMGVILEVVPHERLVTTDAFLPGWKPSGRAFMVAEITFEDAAPGQTRYTARARHWTAEARAEHERMGFHEGWGKAADQLEALARTL